MRVIHLNPAFRGRRSAGRGRSRGVTLIATVLVTALAATIALVAVRQAVMVTRSESFRTDYSRAYTETLTVQAEFERRLRDDDTFYLHQVFPWERPRKCYTPPAPDSGAVVFFTSAPVSTNFPWALPPTDPRQPDAGVTSGPVGVWPQACGSSWEYPQVGAHIDGFTYQGTRAEVVPPTPGNPVVTLRVLSRFGQAEAGLTATYRAPSVAAFTVYSGSDLPLSAVYTSGRIGYLFGTHASDRPASSIQGTLYAAGSIWTPSDTKSSLDGPVLLAEKGLVGNVVGNADAYSAVAAQYQVPGSPIGDIRTKVAAPRTFSALSATTAGLPDVACRGASAGTVTNYTAPSPSAGYTSQLCLAADGYAETSAGGSPHQFPHQVAAWLVLPAGDEIRVYSAATLDKPAGDCAAACDLRQLGSSTNHPGTDPDAGPVWNFEGSFLYPATGVVAADADVYFSRCDSALTTSGTACGTATYAGANITGGGVVANKALTVVAGTAEDPADLWLQGPVATSTAQARVGLIATGKIRVPFWSHARYGKLKVQASLLALDLGSPGGDAITAYPQTFSTATDGARQGWGLSLVLTGSIAAPSYTTPVAGFDTVTVRPDPALRSFAPPAFPGFSVGDVRVTNARQDPSAFCGSASCYGRW